jgi:hypothetical protein
MATSNIYYNVIMPKDDVSIEIEYDIVAMYWWGTMFTFSIGFFSVLSVIMFMFCIFGCVLTQCCGLLDNDDEKKKLLSKKEQKVVIDTNHSIQDEDGVDRTNIFDL